MRSQALNDTHTAPTREPWSTWSQVVDLPAPEDEPDAAVEPEGEPERDPARKPERQPTDLAAALSRLTAELGDERRLRAVAEDARREADGRLHTAETEAAQLVAEVTAGRARIAELERDRDDVIRRAEELLTAVRERADQRLASEMDAAARHWSDLLAEERRRGDALEGERAALMKRVHDAWLAAAVLRRARPLRPRSSAPTSVAGAEQEVLEALEENETDPALAADAPELADEIEQLRRRLRTRLHPADIPTVEDSVEDLREARLARDSDTGGRRRK